MHEGTHLRAAMTECCRWVAGAHVPPEQTAPAQRGRDQVPEVRDSVALDMSKAVKTPWIPWPRMCSLKSLLLRWVHKTNKALAGKL